MHVDITMNPNEHRRFSMPMPEERGQRDGKERLSDERKTTLMTDCYCPPGTRYILNSKK